MKRDLAAYARVKGCAACPLTNTRTNSVPARPGKNYQPGGIAIMGDFPTYREDLTGKPFTPSMRGRRPNAGSVLEQLVEASGVLKRSELLYLYLVRCQPPNGRLADQQSALPNCEPLNELELTTYDPALVILMGNTAMRAVYGQKVFISHVRGVRRSTGLKNAWGPRVFFPTFHPSAINANPDLFDTVLHDLRFAYEQWQRLVIPF